MTNMDNSKTSLSGNVLQMKFMKRSALRIEKEKSEEERKQVIDDEHWVLDLPKIEQKQNKFIIEPSIERCENLMYGRMSFQGFNSEVEKLMKVNNQRLQLEEADRKEKEISVDDVEMAERYSSLVGNISKKFTKKRDRNSTTIQDNEASSSKKSKKFMKPADD